MDEYRKIKRKEKIKVILIQVALFILLLLLWEILSAFKIIDSFLFSKPSKIFNTMLIYLKNGEFSK